MERSGATVRGGYRTAELVHVAESRGPFASVWLARTGLGTYDPTVEVQATRVRRELDAAGAPANLIDQLVESIDGGTAPGAIAVGDESGVLLTEHLDAPPRREVLRWSAVASMAAVIEHRQAQIPVMVVLADRLGADLMTSSPHGTATTEVTGTDDPVRKSAPGGWSQRRYQQRAENTWEHNATLVVDEIVTEARPLHPELIVLGGDGRAVQAILDRLPKELRAITHTMESGRALDGSDAQRADDIDRLVRTAVAEQTVAMLRSFEREHGRAALAANGEVATFEALAHNRVDVLLVHDDGEDERLAWWSPTTGVCALDRTTVDASGGSDAVQDRLVDVAVAAALRAGASIRVVPDAAVIDDGIAALLRW